MAEFVKRKLAEKNRKPSGKKKKGGAAAAAAAGAGATAPSGVSAAAVGLVHAGEVAGLGLLLMVFLVGGCVLTPWSMKPSALTALPVTHPQPSDPPKKTHTGPASDALTQDPQPSALTRFHVTKPLTL